MLLVMSCEKPGEGRAEDRLLYSFRNESAEIQQHVTDIIAAAKALEYQAAMNDLALLSATRNLTDKQRNAVDTLVRQLRYDMEEEIFSAQEPKGVTDE
jgi:hypothetical protein